VPPLRSLCLCGDLSLYHLHRRDTENAEEAQRNARLAVGAQISVRTIFLDSPPHFRLLLGLQLRTDLLKNSVEARPPKVISFALDEGLEVVERGRSPKLAVAPSLTVGWLLRLNPQDCHRKSVESYDN